MRRIHSIQIGLMAGLLVLGSPGSGQISDGDLVTIPHGGDAAFSVFLATSFDDVGGVQGTIRYDRGRVGGVALAMGPEQPDSFVVRSHEPQPGELRFLAYSPHHTIDPDVPLLVCTVSSHGDGSEVTSVLVVDLHFVATPDGHLHEQAERYLNVPLHVEPGVDSGTHWIFF